MIDQIAIFGTGAAAITCTNARAPAVRRWAPIFGLLSEPFWLYTSWVHEQWGIVAMCFIYMVAWSRGVWVHWVHPEKANVPATQ